MTEQALLIDCLRRLNTVGIDYMLTGSMVSNFWGIPRTTHDLDFVVQFPDSAIPRLQQAFAGDFHLDEVAVQAQALDVGHLRAWADRLGVRAVLEDLLSGRIKPKRT